MRCCSVKRCALRLFSLSILEITEELFWIIYNVLISDYNFLESAKLLSCVLKCSTGLKPGLLKSLTYFVLRVPLCLMCSVSCMPSCLRWFVFYVLLCTMCFVLYVFPCLVACIIPHVPVSAFAFLCSHSSLFFSYHWGFIWKFTTVIVCRWHFQVVISMNQQDIFRDIIMQLLLIHSISTVFQCM